MQASKHTQDVSTVAPMESASTPNEQLPSTSELDEMKMSDSQDQASVSTSIDATSNSTDGQDDLANTSTCKQTCEQNTQSALIALQGSLPCPVVVGWMQVVNL